MILLLDIAGRAITLGRITAYDFIAIYSEDFGISNTSLNGENGFAFSELSTRRDIIKVAVKNLVLDSLISVEESATGILYHISESGKKMSGTLESEYAAKYRELMTSVVRKYDEINDVHLFGIISRQSIESLRR